MLEEYTLQEPEQVSAVLNPLRLKVSFNEPKTSAQVARELGETPNRLGHHVRVLLKLGLLVVCYRKGRKIFLQRKARNLKAPFSMTPYSDIGEVLQLALAQLSELIRQSVVYWRPRSDEEFVLLGEEIPLKPQSPLRLLELTLTAEEVSMLEETIRRLSVNSRIKAPGRRFKVGLLLAPLD